MIKLVENINEYNLKPFENNVFFNRILSDLKTMSVFENAMFYVYTDSNCVRGFISKIDGNITLSLSDESAMDEINEFLNVVGFSKILCDSRFASHFNGKITTGSVLKAFGKSNNYCKAKQLYSEDLKNAHALIEEAFDMKIDFSDWFADISHKMRHGGARAFGIYENDILISFAFSLFETEKSAIMSSVSSKELYRNQGLGEKVVKTVLTENCGKTIYVFTENEKAEKWYKKLGFNKEGKWSEIENVL